MFCHRCVAGKRLGFIVEYLGHRQVQRFTICRIKFPDECDLLWICLQFAYHLYYFMTPATIYSFLTRSTQRSNYLGLIKKKEENKQKE